MTGSPPTAPGGHPAGGETAQATPTAAARPGGSACPGFSLGEVAALLLWPWYLAAGVALTARGAGEVTGEAAARVLCAGMAYLALLAAPMASARLRNLDPRARAFRAGMVALAISALALPAAVAVCVASPSPSGTVACSFVLLALAAYTFLQAASLSGRYYPAAAVLWLGGPPFLYYLALDVLGGKATWLLALGPASGAAFTVYGSASAVSSATRLAGPALVLALAGAGLSVLTRRSDVLNE